MAFLKVVGQRGYNHLRLRQQSRKPKNVIAVQESLSWSTPRSLRWRSQELWISVSSFRFILIKDFIFYPYRIQIKYQRTQTDMGKSISTCHWFLRKIEDDKEFLNDFWFSDKDHFLMNGHVIAKNCVFRGNDNSQRVVGYLFLFKKVQSMSWHLEAWHQWTIFLWIWSG